MAQVQQQESDLDRALRMMNEGLTNLRDAQAKTEQLASTAPKATADPKDSLLGTKVTRLLSDSGYAQDAQDINALGDFGSIIKDIYTGKNNTKTNTGPDSGDQLMSIINSIGDLFSGGSEVGGGAAGASELSGAAGEAAATEGAGAAAATEGAGAAAATDAGAAATEGAGAAASSESGVGAAASSAWEWLVALFI